MQKPDLLAALDARLDAYAYGLLSPTFVPEDRWERLAAKPPVTDEAAASAPLRAHAVEVAKRLRDPARRAVIVDVHRAIVQRALLVDSMETIRAYAAATKQEAALDASPVALFMRVVAAAWSPREGGVLREWPAALESRGVPFVRWRARHYAADALPAAVALSGVETLALYRDLVELARDTLY